MLNSIRVLEQIQKLDLEISAVAVEQKTYAGDIERISRELKEAQQAVDALNAEIEALGGQMREIDERIRQSSEKVGKDEKRLNEIKNEKEMNALTREISAANKAKKAGENEKSALNSKVEQKKAELEAKQSAMDRKNEELARLSKELESKTPDWRESVEKKNQMREAVKVNVRPDILKKYEMIRSKRGGLAMAQVKNETCQGCYIHIPPQVYIQLRKGTEELMSCPHCHRILYVESQSQSEAV